MNNTIIKNKNLLDIQKTCKEDNWGGFHEESVSHICLIHAQKMLDLLSQHEEIPLPNISAEPDGEIGFYWSAENNSCYSNDNKKTIQTHSEKIISKQISISIGKSCQLPYAWYFILDDSNTKSGHGVMDIDFYSEHMVLPDKLTNKFQCLANQAKSTCPCLGIGKS